MLDRRRVGIDDHVVDHLEGREVLGPQLLGNVGPVIRLQDVRVRRDARHQDVGLLLGVHQMAEMARMHDVEHAVTHDDRLRTRTAANSFHQLGEGLDLVTKHQSSPTLVSTGK